MESEGSGNRVGHVKKEVRVRGSYLREREREKKQYPGVSMGVGD